MVEVSVPWIGKTGDSNPITGTVAELREESRNGKRDYVLYIDAPEGQRRVSLWGENLGRCVAKWGKDESKWKGLRVQVLTEEKPGEKRKRFILPL